MPFEWAPVIDIPTAVVAVIIAVAANSVKESGQNFWSRRRESVNEEAEWFYDTMEFAYNLGNTLSTYRAKVNAYEEVSPPENIAKERLQSTPTAGIDYLYDISDDDWDDLGDYQEMQEWAVAEFHRNKEQELENIRYNLMQELELKYEELLQHVSSPRFETDDETESALEDLLIAIMVESVAPEVPEKDGELEKSVENIKEICEDRIDKREGWSGLKLRISRIVRGEYI